MKLRPSSFPALAQCSHFESGGASEYAEAGTERHAALKAHFAGFDSPLEKIPDDEQEGVRWAAEQIRLRAPMSDYPIVWETKDSFVTEDFTEIEGTPDAVCGPDLFDFKWRPRDYTAQMACYALMRFQKSNYPKINVHLLFGATKYRQHFQFDEPEARKIVEDILAQQPTGTPSPCEYCDWCAKKLSCPPIVAMARKVAANYAQLNLDHWHPSEITDPAQMAIALTVWRDVLKPWGESVDHHSIEMAIKQGLNIPGWKLQDRAGRRDLKDLGAAFQRCGLPQEQFLACCDVRWTDSTTDESKKGLESSFAKFHGTSKAAAKRELNDKLADIIVQKPSTKSLVKDKGQSNG